jgi:tryptophanase
METAQLNNEPSVREQHLETYGYNVVNIHPSLVEYDLMTDSWTELVSKEMTERMTALHAAVDFSDTTVHAASVFPFRHFVNVAQGRAAEAFFWRAAGKKDKKVIQNLLFPTSRHHVVMNRMTPLELPVDHVLGLDSEDLFRGNLDCARLRDLLRDAGSDAIAWIYIEAENNASGGYPVSMSNVREISAIVSDYGIPMVVDATRLVENAVLIQRFEDGYRNTTLRDIVHEFCGYFDAMTCSLAKDFGITRGGLIGTNDERMSYRITDAVATFGPGINATDKGLINAALKDWDFIEQAVNRRVDQTARLHAALTDSGLAVAQPAAGHCLLFEVGDYLDLAQYQHAVTAFTAWIYAQTGIRSGWHVTGMTREYARGTLVRFAVPLCTPDARIDAMTGPLVAALKEIGRIPDMQRISAAPGITGQMHALYSSA